MTDLETEYESTLDKWRKAITAVREAVAATRALGASAWAALGALLTNTEELVGVGIEDLAQIVGMVTGE